MDTTFLNLFAQVKPRSTWFPPDASASNQVDSLAYFILIICGVFLVFNAGLMVFFAMRYRQKKKQTTATGATHNTALEVTWSVIPAFILAIIFIWGFRGFLVQATPPEDSYDITVVGKQWSWEFHYPNGHSSKSWKRPGQKLPDPIALHVPAGRPVRLTLQSKDVLHSVSIPQMRVKKDVVPGRFNQMWFEANWDDNPKNIKTRIVPTLAGGEAEIKYNVYDLFCTEYCGQDHSTMITKVYVYQEADFDQWLASDTLRDPKTPLAEVGEGIWATQCSSCHSNAGAAGTGPAWNDLMGDPKHALDDGTFVEANEAYITESILNPGAKLAKTYGNAMSAFTSLDPREIAGIIEYMKTLSPTHYPDYAADKTWGDLNPDGTPVAEGAEGVEGQGDTSGDEASDTTGEETPAPEGEADPPSEGEGAE